VASVVSGLAEGRELGLAGGAALIVWGISERATRDLDYFATSSETIDVLAPVVAQELRATGLDVQEIRSSPGFVRYQITDGSDTTELDLAWDYRMRALHQTEFGPVLDRDELAADKVLALYGRAEARDFVDVFRLRTYYTRDQLFALAFEKDRGFVAPAFAESLAQMERRDRIEFEVDDATYENLLDEFARWCAALTRPPLDADRHMTAPRHEPPGSGRDL